MFAGHGFVHDYKQGAGRGERLPTQLQPARKASGSASSSHVRLLILMFHQCFHVSLEQASANMSLGTFNWFWRCCLRAQANSQSSSLANDASKLSHNNLRPRRQPARKLYARNCLFRSNTTNVSKLHLGRFSFSARFSRKFLSSFNPPCLK